MVSALKYAVPSAFASLTMISSRSIKRDAAPENAKPIKNATNAAVDARTRATCRSKGSSAERISEPSQKPSSWAATTPAIRPNATSSSVIRGPLSQSRALGVHDSLDATLTHRFHKGAVVALRLGRPAEQRDERAA